MTTERSELVSPKEQLHPVFLVTNIEKKVRSILDNDKVQYDHWATFFRLQTNSYNVSDHIDAPTATTPLADPLWKSIDSVILSWIYQTISDDLVLAILTPNQTAREAWVKLENLFHDNKGARVAELELEFVSLRLDQCSSLDEYCNKLKSLADRIGNVGTPVGNERLVIQLTNGLTSVYGGVAMLIQQTSPLPTFLAAVSMLRLEERRQARQEGATHRSHQVMIAASQTPRPVHQETPAPPSTQTHQSHGRQGNGARRHSGRKGRGRTQQGTQQHNQQRPLPPASAHGSWVWCPATSFPAAPPCPHPTAPGWAPSGSSHHARAATTGILGSGPAQRPQAFAATSGSSPSLTDLGTEFSGMTLNAPDQAWYMDSGASSHLTSQSGPSFGESFAAEQ